MNPATEPVLKHFNILFIILNLVAGTAVYLTVRQQYQKHRDPLLRRLFPYILSFNLLVAVDLGYQYLMTNLSPETAGLPFAPVGLMLVLVFAAEFGITVSLVRVATEIEGRALPVWAGRLLWAWMAVFAAGTMHALWVYSAQRSQSEFSWVHSAWLGTMVVIIFVSLLRLLFFRGPQPGRRRSARGFAWIFLTGYAGFALSNLDFYFLHIGIDILDPLILLFINLAPVIWMTRYYGSYRESTVAPADRLPGRLAARFGISPREMDIIGLIVAGRSNHEIGAGLFISFSTVKNHVYSIFQKTGVKSRTQLVRLVRELEAERE